MWNARKRKACRFFWLENLKEDTLKDMGAKGRTTGGILNKQEMRAWRGLVVGLCVPSNGPQSTYVRKTNKMHAFLN